MGLALVPIRRGFDLGQAHGEGIDQQCDRGANSRLHQQRSAMMPDHQSPQTAMLHHRHRHGAVDIEVAVIFQMNGG
jgi:hypothetical protein